LNPGPSGPKPGSKLPKTRILRAGFVLNVLRVSRALCVSIIRAQRAACALELANELDNAVS